MEQMYPVLSLQLYLNAEASPNYSPVQTPKCLTQCLLSVSFNIHIARGWSKATLLHPALFHPHLVHLSWSPSFWLFRPKCQSHLAPSFLSQMTNVFSLKILAEAGPFSPSPLPLPQSAPPSSLTQNWWSNLEYTAARMIFLGWSVTVLLVSCRGPPFHPRVNPKPSQRPMRSHNLYLSHISLTLSPTSLPLAHIPPAKVTLFFL